MGIHETRSGFVVHETGPCFMDAQLHARPFRTSMSVTALTSRQGFVEPNIRLSGKASCPITRYGWREKKLPVE
eukprot:scaffold232925_cov53-Attheya_sp.AAC.2